MMLSAGFIQFPGGSEWIIIFLVILIIFGPRSLPKIGHAIGRGIREFKDASDGIQRAIEEETRSERPKDETKSSGDDSTDESKSGGDDSTEYSEDQSGESSDEDKEKHAD